MARILKHTLNAQAGAKLDAQVRQTVEAILADVEARGDQAVRDYSQQFDRWTPPAFKLEAEQI